MLAALAEAAWRKLRAVVTQHSLLTSHGIKRLGVSGGIDRGHGRWSDPAEPPPMRHTISRARGAWCSP